MTNWPLKPFLLVVTVLQLALLGLAVGTVAGGFDATGIRQVIGFTYLTFVPGLLILRLLKLRRLGAAEEILYSVGLSLAFLMFLGFSMNMLYPLIGIPKPIAALPLILTLAAGVTVMAILVYLRENQGVPASTKISLPPWSEILSPPVLFLLLLPLLSILGTQLVNNYNQNSLLLVLLGLIALTAGLVTFNKFIPPELYPMAVAMIAISLLWHQSLISQYLIGDDIHTEYYFQNMVLANSLWNIALPSDVNAMLGITMLGPAYSLILNIDIVWVDKIVHPLFFSLVPLALFQAYRKQTDNRNAFLGAFFFLSFSAFFVDLPQLVRQQVAELFFALSILLFLDKEIAHVKRSALLILFGFSVVVSHYGVSYLYMFYIIIAIWLLTTVRNHDLSKLWISLNLKLRKGKTGKELALSPMLEPVLPPNIGLNARFVMLIVVFGLGWYLFISTGSHTFNSIVDIGRHLYLNLSDMFLEKSRETGILIALGQASPEVASLPRHIFLVIQYITQFFIVAGVTGLLFNLRKTSFQPAYIAMTVVSSFLLLMCIIVPYFTKFMGISRIYHITLFFLAPFCISGGIYVFKKLLQLVPFKVFRLLNDNAIQRMLVSLILVPYILFYTGFIYAVSGDTQTSVALAPNKFRHIFTQKQDIVAAKWLLEVDRVAKVKNDDHADHITSTYGSFLPKQHAVFTSRNLEVNNTAYIFLSDGNIAKDEIWVFGQSGLESIAYPVSLNNNSRFEQNNKIYDDGAVIYATRQSAGE